MENLAQIKPKPTKLKPIARKRHNYVYLFLSILFGLALVFIIQGFPPSYEYSLMNIGIPILPLFFALIAGFIFSLLTFIFIQKTQGILVSFFIILYLILRLLGLTHFIFAIIILVLFITTEIFIAKVDR